ncbi:MAG TPA: LytTR family DNA-binding domain-containing protein [Polyangiaceae bacterium]|nr:LytTR family DNA-binding domain-containing protein [Polyangiaceae bacterium]
MSQRSEIKLLDPQSQTLWRPVAGSRPLRVVGRRRRDLIFIDTKAVLAFEAANRLTFVHCTSGRFDIDASLRELEAVLEPILLRTHRNWLVHSIHVRELRRSSEECVLFVAESGARGIEVPVAVAYQRAVREALLTGTIGLRPRAQRSVADWDDDGLAPTRDALPQDEGGSSNAAVATA